jgi:hypothetical protein
MPEIGQYRGSGVMTDELPFAGLEVVQQPGVAEHPAPKHFLVRRQKKCQNPRRRA